MKRCPSCNELLHHLYLTGWVVRAEFPVAYGMLSPDVTEVGPAVAQTIIDPGAKDSWKDFTARCPECDYMGKIDQFEDALPCILTLEPTSTTIQLSSNELPGFHVQLPVQNALEDRLRHLFDVYNPFFDERLGAVL